MNRKARNTCSPTVCTVELGLLQYLLIDSPHPDYGGCDDRGADRFRDLQFLGQHRNEVVLRFADNPVRKNHLASKSKRCFTQLLL